MSLRPCPDAIDERALVCDGAMGTRLYPTGVVINRCFDGLNPTQPALAAAVRPLVRGVQSGKAGRQFSSILGVLEALG